VNSLAYLLCGYSNSLCKKKGNEVDIRAIFSIRLDKMTVMKKFSQFFVSIRCLINAAMKNHEKRWMGAD
jgi:hypothetical protein